MKSNLLVSKAWETLEDADIVLFVVDAVKRINFEVKEAINRLKRIQLDPENQKILEAIKSDTFSETNFEKGLY